MAATDTELTEALADAIFTADNEGLVPEFLANARVSTFEESGVLTNNAGLVVRLSDGTEFQVTVVRSR